jgi:hypothetical protein
MVSECNATKKDMEIALLQHENRLLEVLESREKERNAEYDVRKREVDTKMLELLLEVKRHPSDYQKVISKSMSTLTEYIDSKVSEINKTLKDDYVPKTDLLPINNFIAAQKKIMWALLFIIIGELVGLGFILLPKLFAII